jgi:PPM family protein phosphatase
VTAFGDISFAGLTDVGVKRSHNQDSHALLPATDEDQWQARGHIFVVADGMGAHAVGELASKLAADGIPHLYKKYAQDGPVAAIRKAFVETNQTIHNRGKQNREFEGMGTTSTALVLRPEGAWIGHVGDSRAYRIRGGRIEQLSFDHSLIWEMARRQGKDPDELTGVPTNVIVRSLGQPEVQVDVEGPHLFKPLDTFVLCSDGLSGPVSDREIGAVASVLPPEEACQFLIHLANLQGGPDNITAVVIRLGEQLPPAVVESKSSDDPAKLSRSAQFLRQLPWPFWSLILGIVLAIGAVMLTYLQWPGGMPFFLLASAALIAGMAGLMIHNARDKELPAEVKEDLPPSKPRVHRKTPCAIDRHLTDKLAQAMASMEEQIRGHGWEADWNAFRKHAELADARLDGGNLEDAFRERCRALIVLMRAFQKHRAKSEAFKPIWDKVHD